MVSPPLNRPREARTAAQDSRVDVKVNAAVVQASDADVRYDAAFYAEVARHLESSGFCLCLHCLGRYCFGTKASADALVSAVCIRLGKHPSKVAHTENMSQRRASGTAATTASGG